MSNRTIPLFEKYRPKRFPEIIGQDLAIERLKYFIESFNKGTAKKKAVLLHGPAGTGKTTLAYVLANELGSEIFELNASDLRNRQKLDEVLKPSTLQSSLFSKAGKIILIDEVDGVTATEYGGLSELIMLIEKTKFPIIITCNDVWQSKFNLLRSKCEVISLKEIPYPLILKFLEDIIKSENKIVNETLIKEIAAKSRGDLRAALNDLQSVLYEDKTEIQKETREIDLREKSQDIFNALREVFKIRATEQTLNVFDMVNMETDQIKLWLEENIPAEYRGESLAKAFEALSKADIFKGRIHRQQHWHFTVYENFFLTAGISVAKGNKNLADKFTRYNAPKRILKMWLINQKNQKKKSIAGKFAELTHTSKKRAQKDFFLISMIFNENFLKEIDLSEDELAYIQEKQAEIKNNLKVQFK